MVAMFERLKVLRNLLSDARRHPLTADTRKQVLGRIIKWQIATRMVGGPIIIPFISGSELAIPRLPGTRGDVYFGIREFEEVGFALHVLREENLFGNVGANIGVLAIAAASFCEAQVVAIEPVKLTVDALRRNVHLNNLSSRIVVHHLGAGAEPGELVFTTEEGTNNRVTFKGAGERVPVVPLDVIFQDRTPMLINIDVEGFEPNVIAGARRLLGDNELKGLIVETNGLSAQYGLDQEEMHRQILQRGFNSFRYDPMCRKLTRVEGMQDSNTLYIRDLPFVEARVKSARSFEILGRSF
jgi:FkbM family methyltransferase